MDKSTLKALKGSIWKWHNIVYHNGTDYAGENCHLCIKFLGDYEFLWGYDEGCNKCPVGLATGQGQCEGTPYYDFRNAAHYEHRSGGLKAKSPKAKELALEELKFLVCLLPEGEEAEMEDGEIWYWEWE